MPKPPVVHGQPAPPVPAHIDNLCWTDNSSMDYFISNNSLEMPFHNSFSNQNTIPSHYPKQFHCEGQIGHSTSVNYSLPL